MTDIVPSPNDPWERLETETSAEFFAFSEFCKLGPSRSLRKVSSHLGVSYDTIKLYNKKHAWMERSKAIDLAASSLVPTDIEMSPTETMAFQFAVGKAMLELGIKSINLKKPGTIKVSDAIKLIDKGSELQRKAQGLDGSGVTLNLNSKGFEAVHDLLSMIEGEIVDADEEVDEDE